MLISRKLKTDSHTCKVPSHITEVFVKEQIFDQKKNYSMSNKEQKKEWCYHKLAQNCFAEG